MERLQNFLFSSFSSSLNKQQKAIPQQSQPQQSPAFSFTSFKCCDVCFTQHISNVPHIKIVCSQCDNVIKVTKLNNTTIINIHCEHCLNTTTTLTNTQNTLVNNNNNNNNNEQQQQQTLRETHGCVVENDRKRGLDGLSSSDINNNKGNDNGDHNNKEQPSLKTRKTSLDNNNNKEHSHKNRVIPRDANNIISQLLYSASLFDKLDRDSIFNLSLTSLTISKVIRPFINENLFFKLDNNDDNRDCDNDDNDNDSESCDLDGDDFSDNNVRKFQIYNPQKIKLSSIRKSYPPNVKQIRFDDEFNEPINANDLPTTLTHLSFKRDFNQPLDHLPPNLSKLSCGSHFNQRIDNQLPTTLTHLKLGQSFSHPFNELLLPNLTHLKLYSKHFNQSIDQLPQSLTHLSFKYYNEPLHHLPPNLIYLKFHNHFDQPIDELPLSLNIKYLELGHGFVLPISQLPPFLTHFKIGIYFTEKISFEIFPPTLTHLSLGTDNFDTIGTYVDRELQKALPNLEQFQFFVEEINHKFFTPCMLPCFTLRWFINMNWRAKRTARFTFGKTFGYGDNDKDEDDFF